MKYLLLYLILLASFFSGNSQGSFFLEQKICDSSYGVFYSDMIQKADGSFFICGYNNVDSGSHQIPLLIKLDANYNEVMRRSYNGSIHRKDKFLQIKEMPNGNLLVLGNLESKDGAFAGIDTNTLATCGRIFIAEMDTLGNFVKTKIYAYCGQTIPTDIALDHNNNIYVAGHTNSQYFDFSANPEGGFETNSFLIRLDTAFNTKWLKIFDAPGSQDLEPHICATNGDEVLYNTNSSTKGGYFNATSPTSTGFIYLSCIDSNQVLKWQKCYGSIINNSGSNYWESPSSIIYDSTSQSSFIIGFCSSKDGDMYDSLDHNPYPFTTSSFIIKLDSLGNKMWSHRYGAFSATNPVVGGKYPYAFSFNGFHNDGFLYLLNTVMYSDTNWTGVAANSEQQTDQWLIKIDSLGILKNKIRIGGIENEGGGSRAGLLLDNNFLNDHIIVGMRSGSINCYPGTIGSTVIFECGSWPLSISEAKNHSYSIRLVPNPTHTICNIMFDEPFKEKMVMNLYTSEGKLIKSQIIKSNTKLFELNIMNLNAGTYLIQLESKSEIINLRLAIY